MPSLTAPCLRLLLAALLLATIPPAMAWNGGAHRIAATIAWRVLNADHRGEIEILLREHPDHPHWHSPRADAMAHAASNGDSEALFAEASVWADRIRELGVLSEGVTPAKSPRRGFPDNDVHRDWHYVNQPLGEPATSVIGGSLHEAVPRLSAMLADPASSFRPYALVWLIHLVGDLHQPLHVATRRLPGGRHDAGGNEATIELAEALRPKRWPGEAISLHTYWDDLVAPPWLAGRHLSDQVDRLLQAYPPPAAGVDPEVWRRETHQLANGAYASVSRGKSRLDAVDIANDRRLAEQQIVRAGYRLAALLAESLDAFRLRQAAGRRANRSPALSE